MYGGLGLRGGGGVELRRPGSRFEGYISVLTVIFFKEKSRGGEEVERILCGIGGKGDLVIVREGDIL